MFYDLSFLCNPLSKLKIVKFVKFGLSIFQDCESTCDLKDVQLQVMEKLTPDLWTPDLRTPDLWTPDLWTPTTF